MTSLRTLFVRGVARAFDDDAFTQIFANQQGVLNAFLVWNRGAHGGVAGSKGHKGIGFVEFDSAQNAKAALEALNGRRVGDRELKIEFAKERESFGERKKRKIQSLKETPRHSEGAKDEDPFVQLGVHARVKSVAVGGVTPEMLPLLRQKAAAIGKLVHVSYPAPEMLCRSVHLYQDGCPSGVALLTFETVGMAIKAVPVLHESMMRSGDSGQDVKLWCRQIYGEGAYIKRNKLIIRNLSFNVDASQLRALLSRSGYVWKLDVLRKKGFAFAYFTTRAHAEHAIKNANGQSICGRMIAVDWAISKKKYSQQDEDVESDADEKVERVLKEMAGDAHVEGRSTETPIKSEPDQDMMEIEEVPETDTESESTASTVSDPPPEETKVIQPSGPSERHAHKSDRGDDMSRKLFVSGMRLDVTQETLKSYMEQFGPLKSVFLVMNKATGKPKGTAFVEFDDESDKDRALEHFNASRKEKMKRHPSVFGMSFSVQQAVSRTDLQAIVTTRQREKQKSDRRNLYLLQEGRIDEDSPVWMELTRTDQTIRKRSIQLKKEKLKNPLFFVSKTRLCIRNLPASMTESELERLVINAIQQRATTEQPIIRQVRLLYDDSPKGKSLRRGFVELDRHEHAICALRQLNANPEMFGPNRRPIVEFAIDNREIINKREEQIQKYKQKALEQGKVINDVTFGFGKKKRKGRNERRREKLRKSGGTLPEANPTKAPVSEPEETLVKREVTGMIGESTGRVRKRPGPYKRLPKAKKHVPQQPAIHRGVDGQPKPVKKAFKDRLDTLVRAYVRSKSTHVAEDYAQWF